MHKTIIFNSIKNINFMKIKLIIEYKIEFTYNNY